MKRDCIVRVCSEFCDCIFFCPVFVVGLDNLQELARIILFPHLVIDGVNFSGLSCLNIVDLQLYTASEKGLAGAQKKKWVSGSFLLYCVYYKAIFRF